ncbi:MAG: sigma 54-interacting transcriptional regulator [Rhodopirellula sp.]|nr:sigma 54-interacting transcriptional regulator [Rhodopirellula sp.]
MTAENADLPLDLEERLRFEMLIADLSSEFVQLPSGDVDRKIENAQRRVCQCLGLDLSALWQWSVEAPHFLTLTHLYRALDGPPTPERMDASEFFPWCQQQLMSGKIVAVCSLDELPAEAARDREMWLHYGIKTSLTFPLSAGGCLPVGALSFNTVREERTWPEQIVKRLQLVAQIITNALARKRTDEILRENQECLELAADSAGAGLWSLDLATGTYWLTKKTRELFGLEENEVLTFDRFVSLVHPEDRALIRQTVKTAVQSKQKASVEYRIVRPDGSVNWFASRGRIRCGRSGEPERVMGVSVDITDRKRAENELKERLQFEKLLADLSAIFVNVPSEQLDEQIDGSLKMLVDFLGNDRSTLVEFDPGAHGSVIHSYAVPGIEPFAVGPLADDWLPWYVNQFRNGKAVFLKRLPDDLPPEAKEEKRYCLTHGIKSNVTVPLTARGTVLGALTFGFLQRHCDWPEVVVSRLQLIGEVFANALLHKRADEVLEAALAENERLRKRLEQENEYLREQVVLKHRYERIIGQSDALKKVLAGAERVAVTDVPVLLLGETGTGKELLAQAIHELSSRKDRPMVIVNCASLPATLIESELFGREAGAYTGAASAQVGRFVVADGSTLFLDEIGEFPIELQAKLLRVLQDGRFERLGSPQTVTVNVRIIAATNRDLEQAVREGKFRVDLYHRLNVFPIHIPPLRERRDDIPLLTWAFVETIGRRMGKSIKSIPRRAMDQLQRYGWPGNVRELSNVVERAMILATDDVLRVELPSVGQIAAVPGTTLKESERMQILRALDETGWRIRGMGGAAEILGLKPTTLEARMAKLNIKRPKRNSNIS